MRVRRVNGLFEFEETDEDRAEAAKAQREAEELAELEAKARELGYGLGDDDPIPGAPDLADLSGGINPAGLDPKSDEVDLREMRRDARIADRETEHDPVYRALKGWGRWPG